MWEELVIPTYHDLLVGTLTCLTVYAAILIFTRLSGLRSFSKITASDLAMTLAVGSLFAATIASPKPRILPGLFILGILYFVQWLVAFMRHKSTWFRKSIDNQPVLLMRSGRVLDANLDRVNVTRSDLYTKLRESNVSCLQDVLAVVFETTGDISVLHTINTHRDLDQVLLEGVDTQHMPAEKS